MIITNETPNVNFATFGVFAGVDFVKRDYRADGFGIKNKLGGKFVFHATFCYFCSINVLEPFYTQYGAYFTQRFG